MPSQYQRVGEYVLLNEIGRGACGVVWLARHHAWTDQLVAVKIVMPSDVTPAERELYEKLRALRSDNPRAYLG